MCRLCCVGPDMLAALWEGPNADDSALLAIHGRHPRATQRPLLSLALPLPSPAEALATPMSRLCSSAHCSVSGMLPASRAATARAFVPPVRARALSRFLAAQREQRAPQRAQSSGQAAGAESWAAAAASQLAATPALLTLLARQLRAARTAGCDPGAAPRGSGARSGFSAALAAGFASERWCGRGGRTRSSTPSPRVRGSPGASGDRAACRRCRERVA